MLPEDVNANTHVRIVDDDETYLVERRIIPTLLESSGYTLDAREDDETWKSGAYIGGNWQTLMSNLGNWHRYFDEAGDANDSWDSLKELKFEKRVYFNELVDRGEPKHAKDLSEDDLENFWGRMLLRLANVNDIGLPIANNGLRLVEGFKNGDLALTPEEIHQIRIHHERFSEVGKETQEFTDRLYKTVMERSKPSKGLER